MSARWIPCASSATLIEQRAASRLHDLGGDVLQEAGDVEALPLCLDDDAGIEYYSQDGGFHGLLRSAIPSATSFMKPSSGIAVVPRDSASAMHSDSGRPLGICS